MGRAEKLNPRSYYNRKRGLSKPIEDNPEPEIPQPEVIDVWQKIKAFTCKLLKIKK